MSIRNRITGANAMQLAANSAALAAEIARAMAAEADLLAQIGVGGSSITTDANGNGAFQNQDDETRYLNVFDTPPFPPFAP